MSAPKPAGSGDAFDPTPGAQGPRELSAEDAQQVRTALLSLVSTFERITLDTADTPPPAGSAAHRLWRSPNPEHAVDGMITMQLANMSACDHIRAFIALVRTPAARSTALATVARGAHESLARSWYLLTRTSDDDWVYRARSLLHADLRIPAYHEERMRTRGGDPVDPAAERQKITAELHAQGLPAPAKLTLSTMVATMLDTEFGDGEGTEVYSTLSAIAHAHRHSVNTFMITNTLGQIIDLTAPRPAVIHFTAKLLGALHGTGTRFIDFYGTQTAHTERFHAAFAHALRALTPVTTEIWPEP